MELSLATKTMLYSSLGTSPFTDQVMPEAKPVHKRIYERTCGLMGATRVYAKRPREKASLSLQVFELRVIEIFHQQHLSNSAPREWLLKETIDAAIIASDCLVLLPFSRIKNAPVASARVDNR
jgi:hypothetical protein